MSRERDVVPGSRTQPSQKDRSASVNLVKPEMLGLLRKYDFPIFGVTRMLLASMGWLERFRLPQPGLSISQPGFVLAVAAFFTRWRGWVDTL